VQGTPAAGRCRTDVSRGVAAVITVGRAGSPGWRALEAPAEATAGIAYIDAAGITEDRKWWLFRTSRGHVATVLFEQPMIQSDAWRMIRRRGGSQHSHADRQPQLPRDRDHGVSFQWRRTRARARPSFTTARRNGSRRTRSKGLGCEQGRHPRMSNYTECRSFPLALGGTKPCRTDLPHGPAQERR